MQINLSWLVWSKGQIKSVKTEPAQQKQSISHCESTNNWIIGTLYKFCNLVTTAVVMGIAYFGLRLLKKFVTVGAMALALKLGCLSSREDTDVFDVGATWPEKTEKRVDWFWLGVCFERVKQPGNGKQRYITANRNTEICFWKLAMFLFRLEYNEKL